MSDSKIKIVVMNKIIAILIVSFFLDCKTHKPFNGNNNSEEKPKISFTFDDGITRDLCGYSLEVWNEMILDALDKADIKAAFFVVGHNKLDEKGQYVLNSWNNNGHKIANHTFSHQNFNKDGISLDSYKQDFLMCDSIINGYSNYYRCFRFPYLKAGNTIEKRDRFRNFLKENEYKNGYVTIDASDWYVNMQLLHCLKKDSLADISKLRKVYIEHLYDRALFYDSLATQLTNRKINHTLLLHHNLSSALFLGDLIQFFKDKGWEILDADKAFEDDVFKEKPKTIPSGESIVWALAKQSGKYEGVLKYPAEDGEELKIIIDKLGL